MMQVVCLWLSYSWSNTLARTNCVQPTLEVQKTLGIYVELEPEMWFVFITNESLAHVWKNSILLSRKTSIESANAFTASKL